MKFKCSNCYKNTDERHFYGTQELCRKCMARITKAEKSEADAVRDREHREKYISGRKALFAKH